MYESLHPPRLLEGRIADIEGEKPRFGISLLATGHRGMDRALGGGLARGRLHELFTAEEADAASSAGFATMLACRVEGGIVWLREERAERRGGALFASGLIQAGLDPNRLILGVLPDPLTVLRAAVDVARCPELALVVIELWGDSRPINLTASRRLALAAEASGVTLLMVRVAAEPRPSAAQTRWKVRSAPSRPLEANAPGHPTFEVELLRQRGRPAGGIWQVEWSRDEAAFHNSEEGKQALSGAMVSLPSSRSVETGSVPWRRTG